MNASTLSLSRQIKFEIILSKSTGGPISEKAATLANKQALIDFFDGKPPAEAVGLEGAFVFAVALGERNTGGYGITINSISQATGGFMAGTVFIAWRETKPSGPIMEMLTSPYVLFRASDLHYATQIIFAKDVQTKQGESVVKQRVEHFAETGKVRFAGGEIPIPFFSPSRGNSEGAEVMAHSDNSFEEAFRKAAHLLLSDQTASHPDQMTVIQVTEMGALYGGIPGFVGKKYVKVRAITD